MRTTLDIDEDILAAARDLARRRRAPLGRVVSDLARQGLIRGAETGERPFFSSISLNAPLVFTC